MKKIMSICIIGLMLTSSFGFISVTSADENGDPIGTHTVLGEYATATWCGYCKYAHAALKELFAEGSLDFYYVSLVTDKNTHAESRSSQLGTTGYPTVFWDGGFLKDVGAGSVEAAKAAYTASINTCGARSVANIGLNIDVSWLGGAEMSITVTINNYEGSTYDGYLRCYVTEIASSMGWIDTGGYPYTFPFLDYAFDETISIPASSNWVDTVSWDGDEHYDGYGNDFGDITKDNTYIIASVFREGTNDVDETAGKRVGSNRPPNTPSDPDPEDGEIDVELEPTLSWEGGDPDWFDQVEYDVYFEADDSTPDVKVSNNQDETTYTPGTLDLETTYYWQIVAEDNHGATATGPIWSFTTRGNDPPYTPSNPDPSNGETGVSVTADLSWDGGDPDGDEVTYDVYFGTNSDPPLVSPDQTSTTYNPGTLELSTSYYWKIVAEDPFEETSTSPIWSFITRGNSAPYTPSNPDPADEETGVDVNTYISWDGGDPDGDTVMYDVYFGTDSSPPLVSSGQVTEIYDPGPLELLTTYYWKIEAEDSFGETANGPLWSFTTRGNDPPDSPTDPDPVDGQTGVPRNPRLDWDCEDPNGDVLYYDVYLDQNPNPQNLVSEHQAKSYYDSDELDYDTTYYWKIVAEDTYGGITEGPVWSFTVRPEQQNEPDLKCNGNLKWTDIEPGDTLTKTFTVENVGEPTSELYWKITEFPDWGTWTFSPDSGEALTPEDPAITVQVTVIAPNESSTFTGNVKVINSNDNTDFEEIPVTLTTPRIRNRVTINIFDFIENLLQRLPLLQRIITLFLK